MLAVLLFSLFLIRYMFNTLLYFARIFHYFVPCSLRFEVLNFDNGIKAKWYNLSCSLTRRMFEKFKSIYQENPLTQIERVFIRWTQMSFHAQNTNYV